MVEQKSSFYSTPLESLNEIVQRVMKLLPCAQLESFRRFVYTIRVVKSMLGYMLSCCWMMLTQKRFNSREKSIENSTATSEQTVFDLILDETNEK
jgi:hypothetical protein